MQMDKVVTPMSEEFDSFYFEDYVDTVYTIDEIKAKVRPILEKYPIDKAWIFGSYSRGEADSRSDVDIAVRVNDNSRITTYLALYDPITEVLLKHVDIFDIREFKDKKFMEGAVLIYDCRDR